MNPTNFLTWFYTQNKIIKSILILSLILIIAYIDHLTPPEMSIRLLYLVPLFFSVWSGEKRITNIFFSFICTIVNFYTEYLDGMIFHHGFYLIWEFIIEWGFFIVFVIIIAAMKKSNFILSKKNNELLLSKNLIEENLFQKNLLVEELTETKAKLEKTNSEKDKFFSIIAHDLRSPFQGFLGLTGAMVENINSFTSEELYKQGKAMYKSANSLYKLLQNLLDWSRMQKDIFSFTPQGLFLAEIVKQGCDSIEQRAIQKGITLATDIPNSIRIYADEHMLNTVVRNLLSNAVKFTSTGGNVLISAIEVNDNIVEVSVSDTGVGISENNIYKLFKIDEKIRREGTEGEPSSGLGLLLCKEFVEKNGGKIWAKSQIDKGSIFYFTVPIQKLMSV